MERRADIFVIIVEFKNQFSALDNTVKSIYMSNVRVLKNIGHLENGVDYFVVNEDQISEIAADGTTFDYSLENGESSCWSDLESELEEKYKGLSFALSEGNEIDIDTWPYLKTFVEFESKSKEKIYDVLKLLDIVVNICYNAISVIRKIC